MPSPETFLADLAVNLAAELVMRGTLRLRDADFSDKEISTLRRAWEDAFHRMLVHVAEDIGEDQVHSLEDLFHKFVRSSGFVDALLDLALPDQEPRLDLLREQFNAFYSNATLDVDFNAALIALTRGLTDALQDAAREPDSPFRSPVSPMREGSIRSVLKTIAATVKRLEEQPKYQVIIGSASNTAIGDKSEVVDQPALDLSPVQEYPAQSTLSRSSRSRISEGKCRRLLQKYRDYLRRHYKWVPKIGPIERVVELNRVYVKLKSVPTDIKQQFDREIVKRGIKEIQDQKYRQSIVEDKDAVTPEKAVEENDHLFILGPAGSGKSTLLRYLTLKYASKSQYPLPIFISLHRLSVELKRENNFLKALANVVPCSLEQDKQEFRSVLGDVIRRKEVIFMMDGFDEIPPPLRTEVGQKLDDLIDSEYKVVVTSRLTAYQANNWEQDHSAYTVLPLMNSEGVRRDFIQNWFTGLAYSQRVTVEDKENWISQRTNWLENRIKETPSLSEAAQNPLTLAVMTSLAAKGDIAFPDNRNSLYTHYIEQIIMPWEKEKHKCNSLVLGLEHYQAESFLREGLYRLGWVLHKSHYLDEDYEMLPTVTGLEPQFVGERFETVGEFHITRYQYRELLRFWENVGILESHNIRGYKWLIFRHLSFQEHVASRAIVMQCEGDGEEIWSFLKPHLLRDEFLKDEWKNLTALMLAQLGKGQIRIIAKQMLSVCEGKGVIHLIKLLSAARDEGAEIPSDVWRDIGKELVKIS